MMRQLPQSILETLAYFAVFKRPLTRAELWRFLWQPPVDSTKPEMIVALEQLIAEKKVQAYGEYVQLWGEDWTKGRQMAEQHTARKLQVALKAVRLLEIVPFIEAIFLVNSVASGTPREDSDIDIAIVARQGRIWLVRLLAAVWLGLFGMRRTATMIADRVCASFLVTSNALDFSALVLPDTDIHFMYWLTQFVPLLDRTHIATDLVTSNQYITPFLPHAFHLGREPIMETNKGYIASIRHYQERLCAGEVGDVLEWVIKKILLFKMSLNKKSVQFAPDTRVVVTDTLLKFHEADRREEYRNKWREMCVSITSSS